ncbi:hypothetical protein M9Y10_041937 [Tritrichomonas musculus]|uniref:Uncharacterized protein n=1 Tax=Tritrichomonas musculus TaxID=1915356 RepID=A0ABR2K5Y3_9EUKA
MDLYKEEINYSTNAFSSRVAEENPKIPFSESNFSQYFQLIRNSFIMAVNSYQNKDDFSSSINQLSSFFSENEKQLSYVDISPITTLCKETGFDRLIFEVFNNDQISMYLLNIFILHLCIILDFQEFQKFFKEYEYFPTICNRFLVYNGEKGELFILCLMKLYRCQYQYQSTYATLFNNFTLLSHKIFDIKQDPIFNYQLSALIISITNSKNSADLVDQNIISGVNSNHRNIIENLPPFNLDNIDCLKLLYRICRKMIKNDCNDFINFLNKNEKLEMLLSQPIIDSNNLKRLRINFFRICLLKLDKLQDKLYLLDNFNFDYQMVVGCAQSDSPKLVIAAFKFFSSFVPDLIDELFNTQKNRYTEKAIVGFVNDVLSQGQFKEKRIAIDFLKSLLIINNENNLRFIRELVRETDDESNIFITFNNLMQSDDNDLKIGVFEIIESLIHFFERKNHKLLRKKFSYLFQQSGLDNDFSDLINHEDERISSYATNILRSMGYQSF